MDMIEWLTYWLNDKNGYIVYLLVLFFGGECIDMILGTVIAKLNPDIKFSSSKWKTGIIIKLFEFGLVVYLLPVFLIFNETGLIAYTTMLIGLIGAEIYSVLGHFKVVDDGKSGVTGLISNAIETLFKKGDK